MWRHCMKDRGRVIGQVDRNQGNSKDLGKPPVSRKRSYINLIQVDEFIASTLSISQNMKNSLEGGTLRLCTRVANTLGSALPIAQHSLRKTEC
ncbi:hypothetical protein TNCV_1015021 [Trichonephila clavipes]|uniref:Uncharacterized protein n=1 Tax=Trichonephila clavipes TaxID=2585209 RepID=A0A8X7BB65_TRICX|nr:hypothetical protein TNCV_1015021 [Trichonephila clavipes]